ncbi:MAG: peptide MFS transporter [Rhizomicrobium sp.]|jgi:POT family proton-dependent oligopeptide transporter
MTDDAQAIAGPVARETRTFFGEPRALAFLTFTEMWERFSYYGMVAILALYMNKSLLLPGHIGHIAGISVFRGVLEFVFGRMSTLALASQIFGFYTAFVYFTPVFGGLIADRWMGRRNGVMLGVILMSAGHIAMAFDASFLLALLLLIVGCGFLKGNISAQVGALYAEHDGAGRTRGYSIYSMGINVGAVAGPILCGFVAAEYGWHAGFGLAGLLMLVALVTYGLGYSSLSEPGHRAVASGHPSHLGRKDWVAIGALCAVMALTVFQSVAFYQSLNLNPVWIDRAIDLNLLGRRVPVPWFEALSSFASIVGVPFLVVLWRRQASRGREPDEISKMGIGAWITVVANLVLVPACLSSSRASMIFPIAYEVILGIGFLYYWPTLLALVSRAAPQGTKATLMGCAFLSLFVSNFIIGWIGSFYERMTPAEFWALHAAIAAAGAGLVLVLRRPLERILAAPAG